MSTPMLDEEPEAYLVRIQEANHDQMMAMDRISGDPVLSAACNAGATAGIMYTRRRHHHPRHHHPSTI